MIWTVLTFTSYFLSLSLALGFSPSVLAPVCYSLERNLISGNTRIWFACNNRGSTLPNSKIYDPCLFVNEEITPQCLPFWVSSSMVHSYSQCIIIICKHNSSLYTSTSRKHNTRPFSNWILKQSHFINDRIGTTNYNTWVEQINNSMPTLSKKQYNTAMK